MGIFSSLLGNAGAVTQEDLLKKYGQLLPAAQSLTRCAKSPDFELK